MLIKINRVNKEKRDQVILMEKRFQLYITLDKPFFVYNDLITGVVHLKTVDPINLEKINLTIKKRYASFLETYNDDQKQVYEESLDIYSHSFTLFDCVSEYTKMSSGHHTFPFQFHLKYGDNATTNLKQKFKSCFCKIDSKYILESSVKVYGIYMPAIHTIKEIYVVNYNQPLKKSVINIELSRCFCIVNTTFNLSCELDKNEYTASERVNLCIESKGFKKISGASIYLYQIVSINIKDRFKTMSCLILHSKSESTKPSSMLNCSFMLPSDLPSCAKEDKFEIKYVLQIIVSVKKSNQIRFQRNININQAFGNDNEHISIINVLRGIENLPKYFNLH